MFMNILILDDEEGLRKGLSKYLTLAGYSVYEAAVISEARAIIEKKDIHCVLLDLLLRNESGLSFLKEVRELEPFLSVIIITGHGDVRSAVECMREGAINYITKPIDRELLLSVLSKEALSLQSRQENLAFRTTLEPDYSQIHFKSRNPAMEKIEEVVAKVKDSDATILLLGETGTGKEITARRIHYSGIYRERPFVSVNCAALNDNLLESELFGHERGAFTGAVGRKLGRFELAGAGTLFLDEVGDMSLVMQSKLLRVLQERRFERVGGVKTLTARCRILAATNLHPEELISQGKFRHDLYYRLSLVTLTLPPLRERKEDIPGLIRLFIQEANERYKRRVRGVSAELEARLKGLPWPGNIRQLKNIITNAVLLSEDEEIAGIEISAEQRQAPDILPGEDLKTAVARHTSELESAIVKSVLRSFGGNISKSAQRLKISRKTMYEKIKLYGI